MNDRVPSRPNRVKVTHEDGSVEYVTWERADEPLQEGTPLNKAALFDDINAKRYNAQEPDDAFKALVNEWNVTVKASEWSAQPNSEGFYTNTVTVAGMRAEFTPIFALNDLSSATLDDTASAFAAISRMTTSNDIVTFLSTDSIDVDIPVRIKGV